jgi:uncharacterized protein (DUF58 family)
MQYTRVRPRRGPADRDPRVYADLDHLVRLQFEAQGFSFLPRQPVHSILYGRHASRMRGRGLNFEELRGYVTGDDIRTVDWKASARAGTPQVRVYSEERDRPVWLLINQRQSMFFGSRERTKAATAAEAAALAAWRVLAAGDRVGAMIFDDETVTVFRPQRSREQVMRVLQAVVDRNRALNAHHRRMANPAMINNVLRQLVPLAPHDCLVCIVGDGSGADRETQALVTRLNAHNDCVFAMVFDPMEAALPRAGRLTATDGARTLSFDSNSRRLCTAYAADFEQRLAWLERLSLRQSIPLLLLDTVSPVVEQVRARLGYHGTAQRA